MATRRERVVLDLTDNLSGGLTRAAAAAALLRRELDGLNGGTRDSTRQTDDLTRSSGRLTRQLGEQDRTMGGSTRQIDRYSGRLALIGQAVSLLGPASIPIAALAVPAVAGLATQLGFAAVAGGTAILAFQGVGDALKAMNTAHLAPTAANLQAAQTAMENLGPAAQHLVTQLHGLGDEWHGLRDAAAEGFLPGVSKALDDLQSRLPQVERILHEIGDAAGDALAGGAASLASARWDDFFNFLETQGRSTLSDLAESVGNVTHALAELLMATNPLSDGFSGWLVTATERLDKWASGLSQTQGFQDFINYIQTNGPQVAETVGAIGSALVDIVTAAAPIGGPILQGLEALANVISVIAKSDLGTPLFGLAAALSALSLAQRGLTGLGTTLGRLGGTLTPITSGVTRASTGVRGLTRDLASMRGEYGRMGAASAVMTSAMSNTTGAAQRTRVAFAGIGKTAGVLGGLALVTSGVAGDMGVMNTVMGATTGMMLGGPWGAAIGGGIGLVLDFAAANKDSSTAVADLTATLNEQTGAITESTRALQAKRLEDDGSFATAQRVGIGLDTVTNAALGQADAFDILDQKIAQMTQADIAEGRGFSDVQPLINMRDRLADMAGETDSAVAAGKRFGEAMGHTGAAAKAAVPSIEEMGFAMLAGADSANAMAAALEGLLTPGINLGQAWDTLRAGLRNLDDQLADHTRSLTANTDGADKNRAAIRGQVTDIQAVLNAEAAAGASKGRLARILDNQRDALIKTGIAAGFSGGELRAFLRTAGLTPKMIKTAFEAAGLTKAKVDAQSLLRTYHGFPKGLKTEIRTNGIPQTMGEVDRLVKKYHLTEKQRTALIALMDKASPNIKKVIALLTDAAKPRKSTVSANTGPAVSSLHALIAMVIPNKSFTVTEVRQIKYSGPGNPLIDHAAGGLILGPGTSTSDSIPANLSTGEYVVKAAAVDKYGADFMHRVNAMQFASGGHVARAAAIASASPTASLVGLRIEGRMSIDGSGAYIRGIVVEETEADRRFQNTRNGG